MNSVGQLTATGIYLSLFEVVALPLLVIVLIPLVALNAFLGSGDLVMGLATIVALIWQLGVGWLARNAARRWTTEGSGFIAAMWLAIHEGRNLMGLMPLVGPLLRPKGSPPS